MIDHNDVPTLTRDQIKRNLPAIMQTLGFDSIFQIRQYFYTDCRDAGAIINAILYDNAGDDDVTNLLNSMDTAKP